MLDVDEVDGTFYVDNIYIKSNIDKVMCTFIKLIWKIYVGKIYV